MDYKDIAIRAAKTFCQAFVATLLATNQPVSKQAAFSAFIAAITVVWNTVLVPAFNWVKDKQSGAA